MTRSTEIRNKSENYIEKKVPRERQFYGLSNGDNYQALLLAGLSFDKEKVPPSHFTINNSAKNNFKVY